MTDTRSRGWCFTINNYTEEHEVWCYGMSEYLTYMVVGKEIGESGTPHLQGYAYFQNPVRFSTVASWFTDAHWEAQKGTCQQAADYCKKGNDYFEKGELPMSQKEKGECGKKSEQERWELAKAGRFEELPPEQYYTYKKIYMEFHTVEDRNELDNLWICGPSGCGKSRFIRDNYSEFYWKPMNKWWDGYQGEDVVILDDFAPEHGKFLAYYLKIWADHYAFNAEIKGAMLKIRPKTFLITSQYRLEDCFESPEDIEAIKRRFKILQLAPFRNENIKFN